MENTFDLDSWKFHDLKVSLAKKSIFEMLDLFKTTEAQLNECIRNYFSQIDSEKKHTAEELKDIEHAYERDRTYLAQKKAVIAIKIASTMTL